VHFSISGGRNLHSCITIRRGGTNTIRIRRPVVLYRIVSDTDAKSTYWPTRVVLAFPVHTRQLITRWSAMAFQTGLMQQPVMYAPQPNIPPWQLCPLLDGPDYFNIVLNGGPGSSLRPGTLQPHRGSQNPTAFTAGHTRAPGNVDNPTPYNTWLLQGCPQHMVGRLDPGVLTEFIQAINVVESSQSSNCCSCNDTNARRNYAQAIMKLESIFTPRLGAQSVLHLKYCWEYFVPPSYDSEGHYNPGGWFPGQPLVYLQVTLPARPGAPVMMMPAAPPPVMVPGQPGYVAVNPMVQPRGSGTIGTGRVSQPV